MVSSPVEENERLGTSDIVRFLEESFSENG
jgi:hypothetical protein